MRREGQALSHEMSWEGRAWRILPSTNSCRSIGRTLHLIIEGRVTASGLRLELAELTVPGVLAGDGSRTRVRARRREEARRTNPRGVGGQEPRREFRVLRFLRFRGLHLQAIRALPGGEGRHR